MTKEFIKKWRKKYRTIKPLYCGLLKEYVVFTSEGFNHLLYARGHRRTLKEIYSRLPLIPFATLVIRKGVNKEKVRIRQEFINNKKVLVKYFAVSYLIVGKVSLDVKVILKKEGNFGKWRFQSIMKNKRKLK